MQAREAKYKYHALLGAQGRPWLALRLSVRSELERERGKEPRAASVTKKRRKRAFIQLRPAAEKKQNAPADDKKQNKLMISFFCTDALY